MGSSPTAGSNIIVMLLKRDRVKSNPPEVSWWHVLILVGIILFVAVPVGMLLANKLEPLLTSWIESWFLK